MSIAYDYEANLCSCNIQTKTIHSKALLEVYMFLCSRFMMHWRKQTIIHMVQATCLQIQTAYGIVLSIIILPRGSRFDIHQNCLRDKVCCTSPLSNILRRRCFWSSAVQIIVCQCNKSGHLQYGNHIVASSVNRITVF